MQINGIDYNVLVRVSNSRTKYRSKLVLTELDDLLRSFEVEKPVEFKTRLRKVILDEMNNLKRDILRILIQ